MAYLKKEDVFFERDSNGNLLPVETQLELLKDKPTVKITPLTKGELSEIVAKTKGDMTSDDTDLDIVIKHCIEPKFSEEDRAGLKEAGKAMTINAISIAIFSISTNVDQLSLLNQGTKKTAAQELLDFQNQ